MTSIPWWIAALGITAPPVTGLLGYLLAARNEEARDKRAEAREERARQAVLAERLEDERQVFQRDVLLELQDRLLAFTRSATEVILQDRKTLKEHGKMYLLGEDLNQRAREAGVALLRSRERVLNDELRGELKALQDFATEVELLSITLRDTDVDQAIRKLDDASLELTQRHVRVNEILGRELRAVLGRQV